MSSPSLPDASSRGSARILYIEDSYAQSRLILALIAGNRMQADWFATGEEALVAFKANAYDLVLTDHDLGAGMNGLDVARHLRGMDGAGRSIPIVVLTGSNDSKLRSDLFSIGVDDYVTKPALPEELFSRIHRLIERHQLIATLAAHEVQLEGVIEQRTSTLLATQRRLQESEFRWKFAIEGSGDGLWDWDIAKGTVLFSTRWKEMLGYDETEIGDGLSEWETRIHPDDKVATLAAMGAYLKGRSSAYVNEHRVRCKDGDYKWILGRGMVVNRGSDGEPLRMIGTHSDISDRKLAELHQRDSEFAARLAS
jgi:PAS domain S-box-containing protein